MIKYIEVDKHLPVFFSEMKEWDFSEKNKTLAAAIVFCYFVETTEIKFLSYKELLNKDMFISNNGFGKSHAIH